MTLTLDQVILHTIVHHSSTSTYMPNFIEIEATFCRMTDGCTYVRTDGHLRPALLRVNLKKHPSHSIQKCSFILKDKNACYMLHPVDVCSYYNESYSAIKQLVFHMITVQCNSVLSSFLLYHFMNRLVFHICYRRIVCRINRTIYLFTSGYTSRPRRSIRYSS